MGTAHYYFTTLYAGIIKGVHRLAIFQHNIVCDINNIVDGTHAVITQTAAHPSGGGLNFDVFYHFCSVAGAKVCVGYFHLEKIGDVSVSALYNRRVQL